MTAATILYDFCVRAGDTGTIADETGLVFRILDSTSTPIDLTGATVEFRTNDGLPDRDNLTGDITVDIPTGTVTVPFSTAQTLAIAAVPVCRYNVRLVFAASETTWMEGTITALKGIPVD